MTALTVALGELAKLPAFVRRDLLLARRGRVPRASDLVLLGAPMVVLVLVGRLVDPALMPSYGGRPAGYGEFVAIGLVLTVVVAAQVARVALAVGHEEEEGTLDPLLATRTAMTTAQLGSVALDLLAAPVRMLAYLLLLAGAFALELGLEPASVARAVVLMLALAPFALGLGLAGAALAQLVGREPDARWLLVLALGLLSGAYVPDAAAPAWLEALGAVNPLALAIDGTRATLLGDAGWADLAADLAVLVPASAIAAVAGAALYRPARARRR